MNLLSTAFTSAHNKSQFNCGKPSLDNYIQTQVSQDVKKKLAACFVIADENMLVKGYYTLSSLSISHDFIPDQFRKAVANSYKDVPVILLGRLAIDKSAKGQGLGQLLLIDALKRSFEASKSVGSIAVVVDPMDEDAQEFYIKFGFVLLENGKMFIAMKTIASLF